MPDSIVHFDIIGNKKCIYTATIRTPYQLIGGELVKSPSPTVLHQNIISVLFRKQHNIFRVPAFSESLLEEERVHWIVFCIQCIEKPAFPFNCSGKDGIIDVHSTGRVPFTVKN